MAGCKVEPNSGTHPFEKSVGTTLGSCAVNQAMGRKLRNENTTGQLMRLLPELKSVRGMSSRGQHEKLLL